MPEKARRDQGVQIEYAKGVLSFSPASLQGTSGYAGSMAGNFSTPTGLHHRQPNDLIQSMFVYRPPKGSSWGHTIGKDPAKARIKLAILFDAYFERVEQLSPTTTVVAWKDSVLPKVEWADAFLGPENQKVRQFLFGVMGDRVMFPMGIVFPLSTVEPASFEFLRRFSTDAPFKMSAKHFMVGIIAKNGGFAWRKPDAEIAVKLEEFVG